MTNNYLKVVGMGLQEFFFFDSFDPKSCVHAFTEACGVKAFHDDALPTELKVGKQARISIFRTCRAIPSWVTRIGEDFDKGVTAATEEDN